MEAKEAAESSLDEQSVVERALNRRRGDLLRVSSDLKSRQGCGAQSEGQP